MTTTATTATTATLDKPVSSLQSLPPIWGDEAAIDRVTHTTAPVYLAETNLKLSQIRSGFACALHMHQPTIPAGENGSLISNLQAMLNNPHDGDNHNATVFAWCYERMGDWIPDLINQGCNPRIMLDYSGNLLWGLEQMGRSDILAKLRHLACDPKARQSVEWLGTMWSHAVAPSTPIPDLKLQMRAWQHQFAALFGLEALGRVKGFSPPEMHLPNHPDTLYEYVKALKECGYRWLMVQEHSIENLDGSGLSQPQKYIPNRLVARNSHGETVSILALVKTQGSDTKLVAQMQPYHESKNLDRVQLGAHRIPTLVTQIADGENGGVMMNEFARDFGPVWHQLRDAQSANDANQVVGFNGTEYLELLEAAGVQESDYPEVQAVQQHRLWQRIGTQDVTPDRVSNALQELQQEDGNFRLEGASWTNDLSWVRGYENVLEPMQELSIAFHQQWQATGKLNPEALLYVLLLETSCFRYWGQGQWTDYARELFRRGMTAIESGR